MDLHFFIGKGGVGKSTVSALSALASARSGCQTLLVSMDPAHNQQDIFGLSLGDRPRRVTSLLRVSQADPGYWTDRYLKETGRAIQKTYSYQGAYNLGQPFDILRLSPGLEAYGLVLAFEQVLAQKKKIGEKGIGAVYFDMPPTARTLDFFSLPSTTLAWLEALLGLRKAIRAKQEIITRITSKKQAGGGNGHRDGDKDRVSRRLGQMIKTQGRLKHCLSRARLHLVMNPEPLSLAESVRFQARLRELGFAVGSLVLNKALPEDLGQLDTYGLAAPLVQVFPLFQGRLTGLSTLDNYLTGVWQPAFRPFREAGPASPWGRVIGA